MAMGAPAGKYPQGEWPEVDYETIYTEGTNRVSHFTIRPAIRQPGSSSHTVLNAFAIFRTRGTTARSDRRSVVYDDWRGEEWLTRGGCRYRHLPTGCV